MELTQHQCWQLRLCPCEHRAVFVVTIILSLLHAVSYIVDLTGESALYPLFCLEGKLRPNLNAANRPDVPE
eukprot:1447145-Amphidinium_carterae.1